MKIALLTHALRMGGGLSVGKNLISALGQVAPDEHYLISIPGGIGYEMICGSLPHSELISLPHDHPKSQRWKFERRVLPGILERFRPDVVVGMASLGYQGGECYPQALLHHNPYLIYPRSHYGRAITTRELIYNYLKRRVFARDLRRTGLIFTPTSVAAQRIRRRYGYRGKCVILPNAISEFIRSGNPSTVPPEPLKPFQDHYKLFYITRYYPHKNIEVLVDLFDRYREELKGTVLFITVAEDQHPAVKSLLSKIRKKNLEGMIVNIGPIPQSELATYFRQMDVLLMPSLLEVFSGSYLEAMYYGVPIITSDLDFAREVCEEAALYFDPWEPASIMQSIRRLRSDSDLAASLVASGKKKFEKHFIDWEDITKIFVNSLMELAKEKRV